MAVRQDASTGEFVQTGSPAPATATVDPKAPPNMHIKVYSPFRVYFDNVGESISAENETGPFDILPHHHNFMTLLTPCEINIRAGKVEHKIRITRGIMHVKADRVIVFLDV